MSGNEGHHPGQTVGPARRSAQARRLGEAAVAAGWRRKAADVITPRVAGSAPLSGGDTRSLLGLLFLAMSAAYLVKTLLTALRDPDVGQPPSSTHRRRKGPIAVPLAGAGTGWRKAVADRVTPRLAARTPLEEHQARALLGAGFIALSSRYVARSLRRFAP